jgi:hypothetical protein
MIRVHFWGAAIGCASLVCFPFHPLTPQAAAGEMEIRFVQAAAQPGWTRMSSRAGGQTWSVDPQVLVNAAGIEKARVKTQRAQLILDVKLTPAADLELRRRTSRRTSTHIALFIEGVLVEAWPVVSPHLGGTASRIMSIAVDSAALPPGSAARVAAKWGTK